MLRSEKTSNKTISISNLKINLSMYSKKVNTLLVFVKYAFIQSTLKKVDSD